MEKRMEATSEYHLVVVVVVSIPRICYAVNMQSVNVNCISAA